MDPLGTTIITAFAVGAAKGATKIGEQAVVDAYAALKHIVMATYGKAVDLIESITGLEKKPESAARRETLAEELKAAGALNDPKLLAAAVAVMDAAKKAPGIDSIGIDWNQVEVDRAELTKISAGPGSIGMRVSNSKIGEFKAGEVKAGADPGK
jgi:hypothetical protein